MITGIVSHTKMAKCIFVWPIGFGLLYTKIHITRYTHTHIHTSKGLPMQDLLVQPRFLRAQFRSFTKPWERFTDSIRARCTRSYTSLCMILFQNLRDCFSHERHKGWRPNSSITTWLVMDLQTPSRYFSCDLCQSSHSCDDETSILFIIILEDRGAPYCTARVEGRYH
jgi:hypothetical protein